MPSTRQSKRNLLPSIRSTPWCVGIPKKKGIRENTYRSLQPAGAGCIWKRPISRYGSIPKRVFPWKPTEASLRCIAAGWFSDIQRSRIIWKRKTVAWFVPWFGSKIPGGQDVSRADLSLHRGRSLVVPHDPRHGGSFAQRPHFDLGRLSSLRKGTTEQLNNLP